MQVVQKFQLWPENGFLTLQPNTLNVATSMQTNAIKFKICQIFIQDNAFSLIILGKYWIRFLLIDWSRFFLIPNRKSLLQKVWCNWIWAEITKFYYSDAISCFCAFKTNCWNKILWKFYVVKEIKWKL